MAVINYAWYCLSNFTTLNKEQSYVCSMFFQVEHWTLWCKQVFCQWATYLWAVLLVRYMRTCTCIIWCTYIHTYAQMSYIRMYVRLGWSCSTWLGVSFVQYRFPTHPPFAWPAWDWMTGLGASRAQFHWPSTVRTWPHGQPSGKCSQFLRNTCIVFHWLPWWCWLDGWEILYFECSCYEWMNE